MITLYAALGGFEPRTSASGEKYPVLIRSGSAYEVPMPQFVLWSSLLWNIYHQGELEEVYRQKMTEAGLSGEDFTYNLQQLLDKRLIAAGTGYTGDDALFELLADKFSVPSVPSFPEKLRAFFYLTFVRRKPLAVTRHLFGRTALAPEEAVIWKQARRQPLSTAELIRSRDLGLAALRSGAQVVRALYGRGDGVHYRNIREHTRFSEYRTVILTAVANLYLKKMVLLESAEKGQNAPE